MVYLMILQGKKLVVGSYENKETGSINSVQSSRGLWDTLVIE